MALITLITAKLGATMPGDFCAVILSERSSASSLAQCKSQQPDVLERFAYTFRNLARGSLGTSLVSGQPVLGDILQRLPQTLILAALALLLGLIGGIPLGLWAAYRRGHWLARVINISAVALLAMPGFLLVVLLSELLAGELRIVRRLHDSDDPWSFVLPVLSLGLPIIALIMRVTRSITLRELARDYVRTARAKGLTAKTILLVHVARNLAPGLLGLVTILFLELIDGALLIEAMFSRPGLGNYTAKALSRHDYPALQGVLLIVTAITFVVIQSAESLRAWLNPVGEE
ncbi:MAG TPA: ABC transporter permease [Herpetosiphonaceae bacterium]|nr:ABC transporter permease [Herpetosiphonaceae bacterium]